MVWTIILAVAAAACQTCTTVIGWRIAKHAINPNAPQIGGKEIIYHSLFIFVSILGLLFIGLMAYRTPRDRAHFSFTTFTTYGRAGESGTWASGPIGNRADFIQINEPLSFNVWFANVGRGVARNTASRSALFIEPNISPASEDDVVAQFEKLKVSDPPKGSVTLTMHDKQLTSAHGPIVSPEDYNDLTFGRRVVYVAVELAYHDDSGSHIRHLCETLQPPQPGGLMIWAFCSNYNDEN